MLGRVVNPNRRGVKATVAVALAAIAAILGTTLTPMAAYADNPGSISGHVADEALGDLPGVTVNLYTGVLDLQGTTTTDASGNYTFESLAPNFAYRLSFERPGYAMKWWENASTRSMASFVSVEDYAVTGIDTVLYDSATIGGTVTKAADGLALAGVTVSAVDRFGLCYINDEDGGHCARMTTDALGKFSFDTLPGGTYVLRFAKPGHVSTYLGGLSWYEAVELGVSSGQSSLGNDVALEVEATISGSVTSLGSGGPIDHAFVLLTTTSGEVVDGIEADESGAYTFHGIPAGTFKVKFTAPNHVKSFWNNRSRLGSATHLVVASGQHVTGISASLDPGASISGRITTAGEPVVGAWVFATDSRGEANWNALTDDEGNYMIGGLDGGNYTVGVSAYDFSPCVLETGLGGATDISTGTRFTLASHGAVSGKNISMPRCGTISGTVTGIGADAEPVPVSYSGLTIYDADRNEMAHATTTNDGLYEFTGLRAGTYYVKADHYEDFAGAWVGGTAVASTAVGIPVTLASTTVRDLSLAVGGTISGNVKDAASADIEFASVTAYGLATGQHPATYTDYEGNYTLTGLPADTYKLQFSGGWYSNAIPMWWNNASTEATATGIPVTLGATIEGKNAILPFGASISGTVTSELDGSPLANVQVVAVSSTGEDIHWASTQPDGSYLMPRVSPGSVTLRFDDWGRHSQEWWNNKTSGATATYFTVALGGSYEGRDASLAGVSSISGQVTDPLGNTLDSVSVGAFVVSDPLPVMQATTDGDGNYTLPGLNAGSYKIGFSDYGTGSSYGPSEGIDFKTEFWNNRPSRATADPIVIGSSTNLTGKDVSLALLGSLPELTPSTPTITGTPVVGQTLTAVPGAWTPSPVVLGYQWKRDGEAIPGKTAATYVVAAADVGYTLSVSVTGTKTGYAPSTTTSTETASVTGVLTAPIPTVSGTGAVGQFLTAVAGAWGPAPVDLSYQWTRNGVAIETETGATHLVANEDAGTTLAIIVTGTKEGYATQLKTSAGKAIGSVLDTSTPTTTGTPTVGKPLTANPGIWGPAPVSLAYQWKRDGTPIPGGLSAVYTPVAADSGKQISVTVTGTKAGYTTASQSSGSITIGSAFTAAPTPTITGTPTAGTDLVATVGVWGPAPVSLAYQWKRDGVPIAGETGTTYTPTVADADSSITFAVTASKTGFTTVTNTSAAKVIGLPLSDIGIPVISGQTTVGQTLTANPGSWSPEPVSFTFQWKRAGVAIAGATAATYTAVAADGGKQLTVTVTGSKSSYLAVSTTSTAVTISLALSAPLPTVTGTPTVGQRLTAAAGVWGPAPVTLGYQWYRDGETISGATASSYLLAAGDAGTQVSVVVRGSKAGYTTILRESIGVTVGLAFESAPVPVIAGTPTVNDGLWVEPGVWAPAGVELAYQWKRAGVAIPGETAWSYTVQNALDLGKAITVTVTGSKDGYTSVSRTSAARTVGAALTSRPSPLVTGTPAVGSTLTAAPGTWGPAPVVLTYQWYRNGAVIAGAVASTYKLVAVDAGQTITVTVTGSKTGFTPVSSQSTGINVESVLVAPTPTIAGVPTYSSIAGPAEQEILTAVTGEWGPAPVELAYQWKRAGVVIAGAIDPAYRIQAADLGKAITVTVTGSKNDYTTKSVTSAAKTIGSLLTAPVPVVSGTPAVGSTLTAAPGAWAPAPVALSYKWNRNGVVIAGAVASSYKLVTADAGQVITVTVSGSKTGFTPVASTSVGTAVEALLVAPVPTISGVPTYAASVGALEQEVLTAVPGEWAPAPVELAFVWKRAGVAIAGATGATYQVQAADLGKAVTVTVTGTKDGFTTRTVTSAAKTIGAALAAPMPVVSGIPAVGSTLTAAAGAWGPAPVALTYKWTRDGAVIPSATLSTYKPVTADAGTTLRVIVTGTKAGYTTASVTSEGTLVESLLTAPAPLIVGMNTVGQTLSVIEGAWGPAPVELSYQWKSAGVPIAGETGPQLELGELLGGKAITVTVTGTKDGFTTRSLTSTAVTVNRQLTAIPTPVVTGVPAVGSTLAVTAGAWAPAPVTLIYGWLRNGVAIAGATTATYKLVTADAGQQITAIVTGVKAGYTAVSVSSAGTDIQALLTAGTPTVVGSPTLGEELSVDPGAWGPEPVELSYQWKSAGLAIAGATDAFYTPVLGDVGKAISVTVTGAKEGFTSATRTSAAKTIGRALTAPVPTVSGTPAVGATLTVTPGTWAPAPVTLSYKWSRNGVVIAGAIASTYKLVAADAGQAISATVTGTKAGYTTESRTSADTAVESVLTPAAPTISGIAAVGETLTAASGTWTPTPDAFTYQWKRAGVAIADATASEYSLVPADAGKAITVTVTGAKSGFTTASRASAAVTPLNAAPVPTITGGLTVGSVQTAAAGAWGAAPVTLGYQWKRNGTPISGATAATYTLAAADVATTITVAVTGSKAGYTTVVRQSAGVEPLFPLLATPRPTITGNPYFGEALSASTGAWGPTPVTLSYQWLANGIPIEGQTSSSYVVDLPTGTVITVAVTGSKATYLSVTKVSPALLVADTIG